MSQNMILRPGEKGFYLKDEPDKKISYYEITWDAYYGQNRGAIIGQASYMHKNAPPPFGVQIAEVEVDTETGFVNVLEITAAYDVGKAVNPLYSRRADTGWSDTGSGLCPDGECSEGQPD